MFYPSWKLTGELTDFYRCWQNIQDIGSETKEFITHYFIMHNKKYEPDVLNDSLCPPNPTTVTQRS